jgi:energy-coupling factor transporter transmembrane protein EcfT
MFKINVITQLLAFLMLAICINFLNLRVLIIFFIILILILFVNKINGFVRATLRFKWFFLVMLVIFVLNTPGEHVSNWPLLISPTYEGVAAGITQMLRIIIMLAGLSLILACNSRQELISGFYFIFSPLKHLGLKVERFAARLWLTLHYVELQTEMLPKQSFINQLKNMADIKADVADESVIITFAVPRFNLADYAAIALIVATAILLAFRVF